LAASSAACPYRHEDVIEVGHFLDDFERPGGNPGYQERFVGGVDIAVTPALGLDGDPFTSIVKLLADLDHLGSQVAHGLEFVRIAAERRPDYNFNAVGPARKGDRLTVITRAGRYDAPLFFLRRQA